MIVFVVLKCVDVCMCVRVCKVIACHRPPRTYLCTYWGAVDSTNPELDVSYGLRKKRGYLVVFKTFARSRWVNSMGCVVCCASDPNKDMMMMHMHLRVCVWVLCCLWKMNGREFRRNRDLCMLWFEKGLTCTQIQMITNMSLATKLDLNLLYYGEFHWPAIMLEWRQFLIPEHFTNFFTKF